MRVSSILLVLCSLALGIHLACFVHAWAVNVPFSDQWQTFTPLFDNESWWDTFDRQHGPHRLGVAFVITRWLMVISSWNINWESYFAVVLLVLAGFLSYLLKAKLDLPLRFSDIALFALIVSPLHYETLLLVPSAYHSVAPLCLLLGMALTMTHREPVVRYLIGGLLCFFSVFTGFGIVGGAIYTLGILFETVTCPGAKRKYLLGSLVFLLFSWSLFAFNYVPNSGAGTLTLQNRNPLDYPRYIFLMFAGVFQVFGIPGEWLGGLFCFALTMVFIAELRGDKNQVVLFFVSTSFLYALLTSVGRIQLGMQFAQSSRYAALLVPGFLAIHLKLSTANPNRRRKFLMGLWCALVLIRLIPLSSIHQDVVSGFQGGKRRWVEAYKAENNLQAANAKAQFELLLADENRLKFLKERNLSFFAE